MAATKKKRTAKHKKNTAKDTGARKQMYAVVVFALGLLLGLLVFIPGERLWRQVHDVLFGLFGWSVYFLAPLMIYIAIIAAKDKPLSTIKAKLWQMTALIVMISGAIQIFGEGLPDMGNFLDNLVSLFDGGKDLRGGGIAGAVFAWPLLTFVGESGGKIVILLCIFVFVMLITGSTLMSLFRLAARPVKGIEDAYSDAVETRRERKARVSEPTAPKRAKTPPPDPEPFPTKFDIDVDISGDSDPDGPAPAMPQHPVTSPRPDVEEGPLRPLWGIPEDSPVEYISPDEFSPAPDPDPAPPPPPEEEKRPHPLDEDIAMAEAQADPFGIDEIIGRFGSRPPEDTPPTPALETPEDDFTIHLEEPPALPDEIPPDAVERIPPAAAQVPAAAVPSVPVEPVAPPEYRHPPTALLATLKGASNADITEELKQNAQTLVDTLKSFGVQTRITDICRGPGVTRYELQPSAGVKISKITGLADDIALNLAAAGIRIEAPIPNKAAVGIEVPNKNVSTVSIRELIESDAFDQADSSLTVALGRDIAGNITLADLAKMPHVLIAGATGSGKSVCINSIIVSLLYKSSPEEVKLLMVDPKVVELGIYNGIPHLLVPVVTDPKKAAGALNWAVSEMLKRYKTFADNSVRDLMGYNRLAQSDPALQPMPKIVIIIDELADLMMAAPGEVEDSICRLAQMARAAGMHLVIATQRPSVDVITGVIKANIPSRIAFAVSSQVDSRTILDMGGAEKLLGRGDMLFYPVGAAKPIRVQGCFVTDTEVEAVVDFVKEGDAAVYDQDIVQDIDRHAVSEKGKKDKDDGGGFDAEDDMLPQAIECVIEMGQASTSALQRRLKLGYARAGRIIDQLEQKGIVGPFEGSKPRQVLISKERWLEMKLSGAEENLLNNSGQEEISFDTQDTAPF